MKTADSAVYLCIYTELYSNCASEQCPLLQVCVCVCVSTAPGVCVCPLLQVCVCVSTAPGVCALGWVKCREHISLLVILCIIVHVGKKNYTFFFFFTKPISDYGKMLKYRPISNCKAAITDSFAIPL